MSGLRAALLPEDGGGDPVIIELPREPAQQLAELQRRIGGNVEAVRLPIGDLWIAEEAHSLSPNILATTFVSAMSPDTLMSPGGIHGPAVLTGSGDAFGDITDLKGFRRTAREAS